MERALFNLHGCIDHNADQFWQNFKTLLVICSSSSDGKVKSFW